MTYRREQTELTMPTVHLNGSDGQTLLAGYNTALEALHDAHATIQMAAPHGRDYYVQGGAAITAAIAEHVERLSKITQIIAEIMVLRDHVQDQVDARNAR